MLLSFVVSLHCLASQCSLTRLRGYIYFFSGDYIYALGGFAAVRLNSVEQYDVRENAWTRIERMLKQRTHATAVVLNNQIFICGGA